MSRVKKVPRRESVLAYDRSYQCSAQRFERLLGIQFLFNVELKRNLIFGTRSREVNFKFRSNRMRERGYESAIQRKANTYIVHIVQKS